MSAGDIIEIIGFSFNGKSKEQVLTPAIVLSVDGTKMLVQELKNKEHLLYLPLDQKGIMWK